MPAKQSAEMRKALRLVIGGMTAIQAAKQAGVHFDSIYRHPEYKAYRESQKAKESTRPK